MHGDPRLRGDDGGMEPTPGTVIPEMRSIVRDLHASPKTQRHP